MTRGPTTGRRRARSSRRRLPRRTSPRMSGSRGKRRSSTACLCTCTLRPRSLTVSFVGVAPSPSFDLPGLSIRAAFFTGARARDPPPHLFLHLCTSIPLRKPGDVKVFANPVDPSTVPGYSLVIARPMDLATVGKRLQKGGYVGTLADTVLFPLPPPPPLQSIEARSVGPPAVAPHRC